MAISRLTENVEEGSPATLRDGVVVYLRRLSLADFDSVVDLADTLSDDERYLRFFTTRPPYVARWATSLTQPDSEVVALGAYDHGELVGVANYTPTTTQRQAEIAIVVAHYQHDRGVGTALLGELIRIARLNGIRHLMADMLVENHAMRRVITDSHVPATFHRDGAVLRVDVDLDRMGTV